jgi:hypothetical protein
MPDKPVQSQLNESPHVGIWRRVFGIQALFRWDVLGAIVPGIFIAIGLGILGVDWFPHHLLWSQVCFAVAGLLCVGKFVGTAIEAHNEKKLPRILFATIPSLIVLGIAGYAVVNIEAHKQKEETTHEAHPTITMTEYGTLVGAKAFAVIKVENPPPPEAPFRLILITRVQDSTIDEMDDLRILKSGALPVTGQTIEIPLTNEYLERSMRLKWARIILVLVPSSVSPSQIARLSDGVRLGGQIMINNGFLTSVSKIPSKGSSAD